jgi:hypothetical protein
MDGSKSSIINNQGLTFLRAQGSLRPFREDLITN